MKGKLFLVCKERRDIKTDYRIFLLDIKPV